MRGLISSVRLQLWIKEEIETIEPVGCPDGPDERGEVGKDVSTRTVLLDDRKDRGRYALGAFVTGQAPGRADHIEGPSPSWGQHFSLCFQCSTH